MFEEGFGGGAFGGVDLGDVEVDVAVVEGGGGGDGGVEVVLAVGEEGAAELEGDVGGEVLGGDGGDVEGFAELVEFIEAGDGEVEIERGEIEAGLFFFGDVFLKPGEAGLELIEGWRCVLRGRGG